MGLEEANYDFVHRRAGGWRGLRAALTIREQRREDLDCESTSTGGGEDDIIWNDAVRPGLDGRIGSTIYKAHIQSLDVGADENLWFRIDILYRPNQLHYVCGSLVWPGGMRFPNTWDGASAY